jgi:hypothetical protein
VKTWRALDLLWEKNKEARDRQFAQEERQLVVTQSTGDTPRPKNKGGHPDTYLWAEYYQEACRIVVIEGIQSRQEFFERLRQWTLDKWGKEPSRNTLEARFNKIYALLMPRE